MQRFVCLNLMMLFLITLLSGLGIAQESPQQISKSEEKSVQSKPWRKLPPLKIKIVKTKKGEFSLNQKFVDGEDWFQGLSISLENTSGKIITHVSAGFIFPRQDPEIENTRPFYKSFSYGKHPSAPQEANLNVEPLSLKPGDTISITLSNSDYQEAKAFLKKLGYIKIPKNIEFLLTEIYFDDGTGWAGGTWFDRPIEHSNNYSQEQLFSTLFKGVFNFLDNSFTPYKLQNILSFLNISPEETCFTIQQREPPPKGEIGACGIYDGFYGKRCCDSQFPQITNCYRREAWIRPGYAGDVFDTTVYEVEGQTCKTQFGYGEGCQLDPNRIHVPCEPPTPTPTPTPTPRPAEICDGMDNDGDGLIDEGFDLDGDGWTTCGGDCDDENPNRYPGNCSPMSCEDNDCNGIPDCQDFNCHGTPIVIDVAGNGFNLTNFANGVQFDLNKDGAREQLSWTAANSDDAWLVLDRNNNGTIDNGSELFGNFTPQPLPPAEEERNGFLALAVHDKTENGGNGDGKINNQDTIFNSLRLWRDANHNGISEASELKTLTLLGLAQIELDYKESKRADEHGNRFRYRAKVKDVRGVQLGRWAWDVFLITQ